MKNKRPSFLLFLYMKILSSLKKNNFTVEKNHILMATTSKRRHIKPIWPASGLLETHFCVICVNKSIGATSDWAREKKKKVKTVTSCPSHSELKGNEILRSGIDCKFRRKKQKSLNGFPQNRATWCVCDKEEQLSPLADQGYDCSQAQRASWRLGFSLI